jgi:hypothetical protein
MAKKQQPVQELEPQQEPEPKPKRVLTPQQLEHLAKIRTLAAEKKREMAIQAHKAKKLKTEVIEYKAKQYDEFQKEVQAKQQAPKKKKIVKKVIEVEESDDDDESDDEEEEEVIVKKVIKRQPPKPKPQEPNINQLAYQSSQEQLMTKVLEHRLGNANKNMSNAFAMQYY